MEFINCNYWGELPNIFLHGRLTACSRETVMQSILIPMTSTYVCFESKLPFKSFIKLLITTNMQIFNPSSVQLPHIQMIIMHVLVTWSQVFHMCTYVSFTFYMQGCVHTIWSHQENLHTCWSIRVLRGLMTPPTAQGLVVKGTRKKQWFPRSCKHLCKQIPAMWYG